jgi:hypothetical protein
MRAAARVAQSKSCETDTWACESAILKCFVLSSERTPCTLIRLESGGLEVERGCGVCAAHLVQSEFMRG